MRPELWLSKENTEAIKPGIIIFKRHSNSHRRKEIATAEICPLE